MWGNGRGKHRATGAAGRVAASGSAAQRCGRSCGSARQRSVTVRSVGGELVGKHGYRGVDRGEEREKEKSIRSACRQEIECRRKLATRRIQGYPEKGSAASVAAEMFISASLNSYLSHSHIFIFVSFQCLGSTLCLSRCVPAPAASMQTIFAAAISPISEKTKRSPP